MRLRVPLKNAKDLIFKSLAFLFSVDAGFLSAFCPQIMGAAFCRGKYFKKSRLASECKHTLTKSQYAHYRFRHIARFLHNVQNRLVFVG
jgi:hypothetical protein